jgi:uncharacterized protein (DUF2126 family)
MAAVRQQALASVPPRLRASLVQALLVRLALLRRLEAVARRKLVRAG